MSRLHFLNIILKSLYLILTFSDKAVCNNQDIKVKEFFKKILLELTEIMLMMNLQKCKRQTNPVRVHIYVNEHEILQAWMSPDARREEDKRFPPLRSRSTGNQLRVRDIASLCVQPIIFFCPLSVYWTCSVIWKRQFIQLKSYFIDCEFADEFLCPWLRQWPWKVEKHIYKGSL